MSRSDYDSPWKEILENYLKQFLSLFYPSLHDDIDWPKGYRSLDKELAKIAPGAELGSCIADKVFEVCLKDGTITALLIHIEVQEQKQAHFPKRMYIYDYRLFDHYQKPTISIALLTDSDPTWRPNTYHWQLYHSEKLFRFHTIKLLDYRQAPAKQAQHHLFKALAYAHFQAKACPNDDTQRYQGKFSLIRYILACGLQSNELRQLMRFIDWAMALPLALEKKLCHQLSKFEPEEQMQYVTSWERMGIEQGLEQGLEQGIEQGMEQGLNAERKILMRQTSKKFGKESAEQLAAYLTEINQFEQFEPISDLIIELNDAAEFLSSVKKVMSRKKLH